MYRDHSVGLVLPVRDAAGSIGARLADVPALVDRVVVVDDGSTDGTAAVVRRAADSHFGARIRLLVHPSVEGPGAATITGYRALLAFGLDTIVAVDPALRLDATDVPSLLDPLVAGDADFVKGNRLAHPGVRDLGRSERVRAAALSAAYRLVTGTRDVVDPGCLHHAFTADAIRCLPLSELWRGEAFFVDLLARVARAGLVVREVPVRPTSRRLVTGGVPRRLLLVAARAALRRLRSPRIAVLPPSARVSARMAQARAVASTALPYRDRDAA